MAVLGSIFAGSWAASGSGAKPKTAQGPPINASSKEEGDFIQYVQCQDQCPVVQYPHWAELPHLLRCIANNIKEISSKRSTAATRNPRSTKPLRTDYIDGSANVIQLNAYAGSSISLVYRFHRTCDDIVGPCGPLKLRTIGSWDELWSCT